MFAPSDWNPRRVIVTGYYDGPEEGIIDLGDHGIFCFEAVAFDFDGQTRLFKLSRVAPEGFESIVATISSSLGPPTWPFWLPIWKFSTESARRTAEAEIDAVCASGEAAMTVLTDEAMERCLEVREIVR